MGFKLNKVGKLDLLCKVFNISKQSLSSAMDPKTLTKMNSANEVTETSIRKVAELFGLPPEHIVGPNTSFEDVFSDLVEFDSKKSKKKQEMMDHSMANIISYFNPRLLKTSSIDDFLQTLNASRIRYKLANQEYSEIQESLLLEFQKFTDQTRDVLISDEENESLENQLLSRSIFRNLKECAHKLYENGIRILYYPYYFWEASDQFYNRMEYYFDSNKILAISFVSPGSLTQFQIDVGCPPPDFSDFNDKGPSMIEENMSRVKENDVLFQINGKTIWGSEILATLADIEKI